MTNLSKEQPQSILDVLIAKPQQVLTLAAVYVEYLKPQTEPEKPSLDGEAEDYDDYEDYDEPSSGLANWVEPVKPSAYVPGTNPNQLREPLADMLRLTEREAANLALKLFKGVRPADEQHNEQTERKHIFRTQTANGLRESFVNGMSFYSRADLISYAKRICATYEPYEVLGGVNAAFFREAMHQAGYVDRNTDGVVFFAPFKTKFTESVLCFMGIDKQPTAEFLDVVMRRVPAASVDPAKVPQAFYYGKRRTSSKEERNQAKQSKQEEYKEHLAWRAANAAKVKSYRLLLDMGFDPLEKVNGPQVGAHPVSTDNSLRASETFDENFFDDIEDDIA